MMGGARGGRGSGTPIDAYRVEGTISELDRGIRRNDYLAQPYRNWLIAA